MHALSLLAALAGCSDASEPAAPTAAPVPAPAPVPPSVYVHRAGRTLYLLDADGQVVHSEPIGIGRGGLGAKTDMSDLITPTGTFTVDLVLHEAATRDAVAPAALARFADEPELDRLLHGEPGLPGLFANMNRIDFDGDGAPDHAYGTAYIGLDSSEAVTGPKMRRHSKSGTPYWYAIALHGTPTPDNLGAANSGGCVHVSAALLDRLIGEGIVAIGAHVTISDEPPR